MRADKVEYSRQKRRALGCRGANDEIFAAVHDADIALMPTNVRYWG